MTCGADVVYFSLVRPSTRDVEVVGCHWPEPVVALVRVRCPSRRCSGVDVTCPALSLLVYVCVETGGNKRSHCHNYARAAWDFRIRELSGAKLTLECVTRQLLSPNILTTSCQSRRTGKYTSSHLATHRYYLGLRPRLLLATFDLDAPGVQLVVTCQFPFQLRLSAVALAVAARLGIPLKKWFVVVTPQRHGVSAGSARVGVHDPL